MVTVKPVGWRVLVEYVETPLGGGIVLPNGGSNILTRWKVVAIGDPLILENGERIPINLKIGEEVAFTQGRVSPLTPAWMFGNRKLALIYVGDIIAVFEGQPDLIDQPTVIDTSKPAVIQ